MAGYKVGTEPGHVMRVKVVVAVVGQQAERKQRSYNQSTGRQRQVLLHGPQPLVLGRLVLLLWLIQDDHAPH